MTDAGRRLFLSSLAVAAIFPGKTLARALERNLVHEPDTILMLMNSSAANSRLVALRGRTGRWKQFDLPMPSGLFGAHSEEVSPADPSLLAIFPFRLDKMLLFSLKEGKVLRELKSKPGFLFSGHGLFHSGGKQFMATEFSANDSENGMISLRSAEDGSVLEELGTGARHPHQIAGLDKKMETLAVSHYGFHEGKERKDLKSKIVFYDFGARKALQTVDSPIPNAALCHIVANSRGEVFISVQDRVREELAEPVRTPLNKFFPAPVFSARRGQSELKEWDAQGKDEKLLFSFSTAFSEKTGVLGMVHIGSSSISFWSAGERKLLRLIELPGQDVTAINVCAGGDKFFYNTNSKGKSRVVMVNARTLREEPALEIPVAGSITHHMSRTAFPV